MGLAVRRLVADGRWHIMGGWYITFYYQECPEWVYKTNWGGGLAWNNRPSWTEQAEFWEKELTF